MIWGRPQGPPPSCGSGGRGGDDGEGAGQGRGRVDRCVALVHAEHLRQCLAVIDDLDEDEPRRFGERPEMRGLAEDQQSLPVDRDMSDERRHPH